MTLEDSTTPEPPAPTGVQKAGPYLAGLAVAVGALAFANRELALRAERAHPPIGRFVTVDGVRLHYAEYGEGAPLVLLHGNGSMIQEFLCSGLVDLAARRHRVILFDRPGYGHSPRPSDRVWDAEAQARLIHEALVEIGISRAVILGHSWGASVAMAMALAHLQSVAGLVLVSGYYYPSPRADALLASVAAAPVLGPIARHTVLPVTSRLASPAFLRKIFAPAPVPARFRAFPLEMAVRPSQLQAEAAESGLLIADAAKAGGRYRGLARPAVIVAGEGDRMIDPAQSRRLHHEIRGSSLHLVPGSGHMVHHTNPGAVMAAIEEAFALAGFDLP